MSLWTGAGLKGSVGTLLGSMFKLEDTGSQKLWGKEEACLSRALERRVSLGYNSSKQGRHGSALQDLAPCAKIQTSPSSPVYHMSLSLSLLFLLLCVARLTLQVLELEKELAHLDSGE